MLLFLLVFNCFGPFGGGREMENGNRESTSGMEGAVAMRNEESGFKSMTMKRFVYVAS